MKVHIGNFPKHGERKVQVHIDGYDTWNLDSTLALIILPALLQLKKEKNGVPSSVVDNVGGEEYASQKSFDFYQETHEEAFKIACEKWDEILDKMIWSFHQIAFVDYEHQYFHGQSDFDWVKSDVGVHNPLTGKTEETFQMIDKNPKDHWIDFVGLQLHEQRIQEGLDLFGTYYRNLWD